MHTPDRPAQVNEQPPVLHLSSQALYEFIQSPPSPDYEKTKAVQEVPVPLGWTLLIHGTDTSRWNIDEPVKKVARMGLSAITSEDAENDRQKSLQIGSPGAYDTTTSYARPRRDGAMPVEIRIPFYREDLSRNRVPHESVAHIKKSFPERTQKLVSQYHQPRHAVVPADEVLIRLTGGFDESSQRIVEYFLPQSVAADYLEAVARDEAKDRT